MATQFAIFKSAVSQVLAKLEAQNFITRESNPNNHREFFIVLAEQGLTYQTINRRSDEEFAEKHYALIDLDSLRNVLETMKKVNASISKSNNRIAICLTIN
ncbi:MarR family transcriptional regulator [Bacillus sp. ISL-75]|uniref:MarR family transcriptional regulator n=1 Tax=Bacillus sp. ISL-75 TaxID=2819137 RepID=UPI001BEB84E5|nr:MarR family transcriptional regulator [Bacillus sp. ISL-75]